MKKTYTKPMIAFEAYALDMPIAAGCAPDSVGIAKELEEMGYFGESCYDLISDDFLDAMYGDDKICYYTMASQLFTS